MHRPGLTLFLCLSFQGKKVAIKSIVLDSVSVVLHPNIPPHPYIIIIGWDDKN